jgi:hypothetical protein
MAAFIKKHWRSELVTVFGVALSISLFWMENRAESSSGGLFQPAESSSLKGYGGNLPAEVQSVIQEMAGNLAQAQRIETAQPRCIEITDKTGTRRTYGFDHDAVWRDGNPVIGNVRSFHFEYRDQWGNLLTRSDSDPGSIRSVGLAIRITDHGRDIAASIKVALDREAGSHAAGFASAFKGR